ncbi:MAG: hypothetical protein H6607_00080 [Flavobacteriales bacterium]|nr:hypothetical protein [Flavobacteriales bacterium]
MKRTYFFGLVSILFLTTLTITNCAPDSSTSDDQVTLNNLFCGVDQLSQNHTVGTSPCPQDISTLNILLTEDPTIGHPDSISVTLNNTSLDAFFQDNGERTIGGLAVVNSTKLRIMFTCATQESFTGTVSINYFKDGKLVLKEDVDVTMNITK